MVSELIQPIPVQKLSAYSCVSGVSICFTCKPKSTLPSMVRSLTGGRAVAYSLFVILMRLFHLCFSSYQHFALRWFYEADSKERSEVFPQPDGPIIATNSPSFTVIFRFLVLEFPRAVRDKLNRHFYFNKRMHFYPLSRSSNDVILCLRDRCRNMSKHSDKNYPIRQFCAIIIKDSIL